MSFHWTLAGCCWARFIRIVNVDDDGRVKVTINFGNF